VLKVSALWSTVDNASQSALVNLPKAVAGKEWTTVNVGVVTHGMNLSNRDGLGGGVSNLLLEDGFIHGDGAKRLTFERIRGGMEARIQIDGLSP
jgi:hypothetical protein